MLATLVCGGGEEPLPVLAPLKTARPPVPAVPSALISTARGPCAEFLAINAGITPSGRSGEQQSPSAAATVCTAIKLHRPTYTILSVCGSATGDRRRICPVPGNISACSLTIMVGDAQAYLLIRRQPSLPEHLVGSAPKILEDAMFEPIPFPKVGAPPAMKLPCHSGVGAHKGLPVPPKVRPLVPYLQY